MGDMQTSGPNAAQQKWAAGFTGLPLTKASPAGAPAAAPAASAGDEKTRAMDASWTAAVAAGDWKTAATVVNGYSPDDLRKRLQPLSVDQRGKLHQGALQTVGDKSAVAQATNLLAALPVGVGPVGFECKSPPLEATVAYAKLSAGAKFSVSYSLVDAGEQATEVKFKNLAPEIETTIKSELCKGTTLKGSANLVKAEGSIGVDVAAGGAGPLKQVFGFSIMSGDAKKGEVRFAQLSCTTSAALLVRTIEVKGIKIKFSGSVSVTTSIGPNWAAIAKYALKELGVTIAENAAAGVAAGGTGTAGAVAVAAAPVAGILGGIAGGFALAAGVCASIGKLQDFGRDSMEVCQEGKRELRAYAESYGSTMRGKPGGNKHGTDDAETALQEIMAKTPGMTHQQAVDAATGSKQNYENLAFRRLLPIIRAQVEAKYKAKEGMIGWFFSYDTLNQHMKYFLGENDSY